MAQIKNTLLTIAIPTYNRPDKIELQVRTILPQLNTSVSLIVYDNCSNVEIKSLFSEVELNKFTIVRNKINIGGDANIARCLENATSKWLWTLSDDDLVSLKAVKCVIDLINNHDEAIFINLNSKINLVCSNFSHFSTLLENKEVYSNLFSLSNCIYKVEPLKEYFLYCYDYLSSMRSPLIMLIKYLYNFKESKIVFTKTTYIDLYNLDVGWNYSNFIKRSFLFEVAISEIPYNYRRSLLIGHYSTLHFLIRYNRVESKVKDKERIVLFIYTLRSFGIINSIKYSKRDIFYFIRSILKSLFIPRR